MHAMADTARRIVIATWTGTNGAEAGFDRLRSNGVSLGNVAIVTRDASGKVSFRETDDWGVGKSALIGAIAGLILPGVGTITLAAAGAAAAYFIDLGFPDALLKQIGDGIAADSSTLIALVASSDVARAESLLAEGLGTVIATGDESDLAAAMAKMTNRPA
jgi:uncharacterized membrane protein